MSGDDESSSESSELVVGVGVVGVGVCSGAGS